MTRIMPSVRLCITVFKVKCKKIAAVQHGHHLHAGGRMPLLRSSTFL